MFYICVFLHAVVECIVCCLMTIQPLYFKSIKSYLIVSSRLMCKVIYKQVRFILNWIFSLIYSLINVLQDTTYKLNTIYISQYMSRSSIIAMTNHMIIMVCESDILYVRFYLYHAKSLLLYLIQSPFVIQPQAIFLS